MKKWNDPQTTYHTRLYGLILFITLFPLPGLAEEKQPVKIRVELDLGKDLGQNFGTLFELRDESGEPILGAGFPGIYNTHDRSDRYVLHFYCRTAAQQLYMEALPRPGTDCGVYLADIDGKLIARSLFGGKDMAQRIWDASSGKWKLNQTEAKTTMRVRGKWLCFFTNRVDYDGQPVLEWSGPGSMEPFYYANGWLIVRHHFPNEPEKNGQLIALAWSPYESKRIDPARGLVLNLPARRAFPYACSTLGEELLITTNIGQVHRLTAQGWTTLRETDGKSYQVYSSLYTQDRLWLGQYPTGHLFEYRQGKITHLPDQPPRMPGVSSSARELQSLAVYRGDVYAGVWPWGEVWRYRAGKQRWEMVQRLFTHPQPTDATIHPYERETAAVDPVANLWGQRISSMVALGDALYISTSAKGTPAFDPRFSFLVENNKWQEYGKVYRCRLPGQLATPIHWQDQPLQLEFQLEKGHMRILQNGTELAGTLLKEELLPDWNKCQLFWGTGLFGTLTGKITAQQVTGIETKVHNLPRHEAVINQQ